MTWLQTFPQLGTERVQDNILCGPGPAASAHMTARRVNLGGSNRSSSQCVALTPWNHMSTAAPLTIKAPFHADV
jgi:hypothetical protein